MKLYALAFIAFAAVLSAEAAKPALHPARTIPSSLRAKKQSLTPEDIFFFGFCPYTPTAQEMADFYSRSDVLNCLNDVNDKLTDCLLNDPDPIDCSIREGVEVGCDAQCSNAGDAYFDICFSSLNATEFAELQLAVGYATAADCGRGPNGELCGYISAANPDVLTNAIINCPAPVQDTPLECPADCKTSVQQGKDIYGCCLNNYLGDVDRATAFGLQAWTFLASDELFTACDEGTNVLGECLGAAWAQSSVAILGAVVIAVMTSLMA